MKKKKNILAKKKHAKEQWNVRIKKVVNVWTLYYGMIFINQQNAHFLITATRILIKCGSSEEMSAN